MYHKNHCIQIFAPSLNWLRVGDRVGILRTHDRGLKAFINGEELSVSFPSITENPYIFVDLRGSCVCVSVLSRRLPASPLASVHLQDSLELMIGQEHSSTVEVPIVTEECTSEDVDTNDICKFEFHENHGRNIEIMPDRYVSVLLFNSFRNTVEIKSNK